MFVLQYMVRFYLHHIVPCSAVLDEAVEDIEGSAAEKTTEEIKDKKEDNEVLDFFGMPKPCDRSVLRG